MDLYQPKSQALDMRNGATCLNGSGEDIPANSVCEISSVDSSGIITVVKPTGDSLTEVILSPSHIVPEDAKFIGISPYDEFAAINGTFDVGDDLGSVSGQWYMQKDNSGFKCLGGSGGVARVRPFSYTNSYFSLAQLTSDQTSYGWRNAGYDWEDGREIYSDEIELTTEISEVSYYAKFQRYRYGGIITSNKLIVLPYVQGSSYYGVIPPTLSLETEGESIISLESYVKIRLTGLDENGSEVTYDSSEELCRAYCGGRLLRISHLAYNYPIRAFYFDMGNYGSFTLKKMQALCRCERSSEALPKTTSIGSSIFPFFRSVYVMGQILSYVPV